ncbi:hypothetical protein PV325_008144 [Microctonus aethiopoides]|uniref:Uncharacterized protein n=1 Tax=Microctonus aethiopoides TaxID=144406 RepID=A0AA39F6U8_9HYME|nr:hypothetical protein PV325_008144 [Microctonus aethiopoides]KAK0164039.1 hypothetical protein PV328_002709 [Microctonus aethiopoides]
MESKSLLEWDMSRVYAFVPWKSTTTKAKPRKQLCLTIGIYTNVLAYIYSQDTCVSHQFEIILPSHKTLEDIPIHTTKSKMAFVKLLISTLAIIAVVNKVNCIPKYNAGGFVPSSMDYYDKMAKSHDQMAVASETQMKNETNVSTSRSLNTNDNDSATQRNQEPRFGFTNVGSTGSGYAMSPYGPAKVDLGGLILGAVIGVGTILIIPKLLYIISGSYGAYARSDEGGFTQSMTKLDDILAHHGIDTTSCMQRAVCTYARKSTENSRTVNDINDDNDEKVSSFEKIIDTVTNNQIFRTAMRGTAVQEAIEAGRNSQNCSRIYRQCGFSMESIIGLMSNVISSVTSDNSRPTGPTAAAAA